MQFNFREASEEERMALRSDPERCISLLGACKDLASRIAADAGVYTTLSEDDERVLQHFHWVSDAHQGYQYEGTFEQLYKQAGLLHSDIGLLIGRIQTLYLEKEPILALAEAESILFTE